MFVFFIGCSAAFWLGLVGYLAHVLTSAFRGTPPHPRQVGWELGVFAALGGGVLAPAALALYLAPRHDAEFRLSWRVARPDAAVPPIPYAAE